MAINYQVGDVVKLGSDLGGSLWRALVVDITEKAVFIELLHSSKKGHQTAIPNCLMRHLTKDEVGTLLYGNKEKQHSQT